MEMNTAHKQPVLLRYLIGYLILLLLNYSPVYSQDLLDKKVQQALVFDLTYSANRIAGERFHTNLSIYNKEPRIGFAIGYAVLVKLKKDIYYRGNVSLQTARDSSRIYSGYHYLTFESLNRRFDALRLSNHLLYDLGEEKSFFLLTGISNYLDMTRERDIHVFRFSRIDHSWDIGIAKTIKSDWGYWMPELKMHYGLVNHFKKEERNEDIWGFYRRRIVLSVYFLF